MKREMWLASLGVVLVTSLVFSLGAKKMLRADGDVVAPEETVAIDATNFPDDTFRGYVKQFDKNGDSAFGEEELKKVYEIDCSNRKISSLKGIEFFTELEKLDCSINSLKELDVTRLYTTFMGRDPKPEEVTYWTGEIAKGTQTRDSVLAFFGSCDEFTNICKKYGIDRRTI